MWASWIWIAATVLTGVQSNTAPFSPAEKAVSNRRAFEVLRILQRAENNCPSGTNPCTSLGNANACCRQGTNCSRDAADNIACCATGASCTGSLTGTTTTSTGTGFMFPNTATATATTDGSDASITGSTLDGAYPFVYVPTAFNNPETCSSYYSVCQSEYTQCTGALLGRYGVTIGGSGSGKTVEAVTAASQATSICSSLSLEACHGINLGYCGSVATQTGDTGASGNHASSGRSSSLHDLALGLAIGVAGMFI